MMLWLAIVPDSGIRGALRLPFFVSVRWMTRVREVGWRGLGEGVTRGCDWSEIIPRKWGDFGEWTCRWTCKLDLHFEKSGLAKLGLSGYEKLKGDKYPFWGLICRKLPLWQQRFWGFTPYYI